MGAVYDDLPGHEGYALEHGGAHIGACSCGWSDDHPHLATGDGADAAVDRWDQLHAGPLLERAVPTGVTELVDQAHRAIAHLARTRPKAATELLDSVERRIGQLRGLAHDFDRGMPTVGQRLSAPRRPRS